MSFARTAIPMIAALILAASPAFAAQNATPFCPAGEKKVCTLGPPPVCSCKPDSKSVIRGSAVKATIR
jgi:hypothetical protein